MKMLDQKDVINPCQDERLIIVLTAIHRVAVYPISQYAWVKKNCRLGEAKRNPIKL